MQIRIPRKRVREAFLLIYELKGCQKAVGFLTEHYRVKRMKIIRDGKRVGTRKSNGWLACYSENEAFFSRQSLNRKNVLHEFFHHLVDSNGLEMPIRKEEKEANGYSRKFLRCS